MSENEEKNKAPSCDDCGYYTQKKDLFNRVRAWCLFHEKYQKPEQACPYFVNSTDVGFGKEIYFILLENAYGGTLSENDEKIRSLIKTATTLETIDEDMNITQNCTHAAPAGLDAMFKLGECYRAGVNTEKDEKIAFYYYRVAAQQNHPDSLLMAGLCYLLGVGIEKDENKGFMYINRAARLGQPFAGYYAGQQDKKKGNPTSAKSNFNVGAKRGHAWSQYMLGSIYLDEWVNGKSSSFETAIFWLACAYLHGDKSPNASKAAMDELNYQIKNGCPVERIRREMDKIKRVHPEYLANPKPNWYGAPSNL